MRLACLVLLTSVAIVGCASSYQSAHVLAPGKTQVSAAVTRIEQIAEDGDTADEDGIYVGDVRVAHGIADKVDANVRLTRAPGSGDTVSMMSAEARFELTAPEAPAALSIGLPIGILWAEEDELELDYGGLVVMPTLYAGYQVSPGVELVAAPKLFITIPDEGDTQLDFGGSLGVRISDLAQTWHVQPELGLAHFSDEGDSATFLLFGLSIGAGN
ncbi:MAG TPA: hypothetical protein VFQ53_25950 [Kofleriaceae bacterium]|nr:hypothetical protein [Kofleriaceae bacterium]